MKIVCERSTSLQHFTIAENQSIIYVFFYHNDPQSFILRHNVTLCIRYKNKVLDIDICIVGFLGCLMGSVLLSIGGVCVLEKCLYYTGAGVKW